MSNDKDNPFAINWQDCLRAHYNHVVREHDLNNEQSLITVLIDTGFSEDDILALREAIVGPVEQPEPEGDEVAVLEADLETVGIEALEEPVADGVSELIEPANTPQMVESAVLDAAIPDEAVIDQSAVASNTRIAQLLTIRRTASYNT